MICTDFVCCWSEVRTEMCSVNKLYISWALKVSKRVNWMYVLRSGDKSMVTLHNRALDVMWLFLYVPPGWQEHHTWKGMALVRISRRQSLSHALIPNTLNGMLQSSIDQTFLTLTMPLVCFSDILKQLESTVLQTCSSSVCLDELVLESQRR